MKDNYDDIIKTLTDQVGRLDAGSTTNDSVMSSVSSITTKLKPSHMYILVVVVVFIGLCYFKPSSIMKEVSIDGDYPTKVIDKTNLIMVTLIASAIIIGCIFIYKYKKNSDV